MKQRIAAILVWALTFLVAPSPSALHAQTADELRIVARDPNGHGLLCEARGKTVLLVGGTPEQMGSAHGTLLKRPVQAMVEKCLYLVGAGYSMSKNDWFFDRIDEVMRRTRPHTPERFLHELDALSTAAELTERDGRAMNFFPEMFHCSGVAVRGSATKDGRVLHARVLDYMRDIGLQDYACVQVFMPEGYNAWISLGYAGFVGTVTCMNAKGLAMGEMGGRGEGNWDGLPMSLLMREVMERAGTVQEALVLLKATPRTCEYYYVLSDAGRDIAGVYATPDTLEILTAGEQNERLPHVPADTVLFSGGSRAKKLSERLTKHHGTIDVETMIDIIKRPVAMRSNLHNAIFSPETREMWCADAGRKSPACDEPYRHFNLDELIAFYRTSVVPPARETTTKHP